MGNECCLHRMQLVGHSETFNRRDLISLMNQSKAEAGVYAFAVHMHRTGATLTVVAALLRSGQMEDFAQAIEQRGSRVDAELVLPSIDMQADCHGSRPFS